MGGETLTSNRKNSTARHTPVILWPGGYIVGYNVREIATEEAPMVAWVGWRVRVDCHYTLGHIPGYMCASLPVRAPLLFFWIGACDWIYRA